MTAPQSARDEKALREFLEFAAVGARLVARGREAYDRDEMLRLAAEAILHKIGEAVARLSDHVTAGHPQVNWRPMKGMRNVVAHDYGAIDHDMVWNALADSLPREASKVRNILDA